MTSGNMAYLFASISAVEGGAGYSLWPNGAVVGGALVVPAFSLVPR